MNSETTTLIEVYKEYAVQIGKEVDGLSEDERRQAYLNAILADRRVEPFATYIEGIRMLLIDERATREFFTELISDRKPTVGPSEHKRDD